MGWVAMLLLLFPEYGLGENAMVTYTAEDYAFAGPKQISSGWQTVRLSNRGRDVHQIQFLELPIDKGLADIEQALTGGAATLPAWLRRHGGVNSVAPGHEARVVIHLPPGEYVVLCGIPNARGRAHALLGMMRPLHVVQGSATASPARTDTILRMKEFSFALSEPLTAGPRMLHVINNGTDGHELVVIHLAADMSAQDFVMHYRPGGAPNPAGIEAGGMTGLDPGRQGYVYLDVEPGRYGLLCFLADSITRTPHFHRGMWMDVEVNPYVTPSGGR
jgi:uncharacterized cupredoxin-like copper-binding protein